ncbi:MAG: hypothetical protein ABI443_05445 [Chthoniobacterales bacterium]
MKRFLSFIATFLVGIVISLQAQDANPATDSGLPPLQQTIKNGNGERLVAGLLVQEMKSRLNLTDAQVKQVIPLFEDKVKAMQSMRDDSTSFQQLKDITMTFNTKVDAILTPEQKTKWKQYQEDLMAKAKERHDDLMNKAPVNGGGRGIAVSKVSAPATSPEKNGEVQNYGPATIFLQAVKDAKLNLSDSQIKKIIAVYQERRTTWGAIQNNSSLSDDQKIDQCFAATKVCNDKMDTILDAQQRAKRDACLKAGLGGLKRITPSK